MSEQELLSARIMFFCKEKRMTYYKLFGNSADNLDAYYEWVYEESGGFHDH